MKCVFHLSFINIENWSILYIIMRLYIVTILCVLILVPQSSEVVQSQSQLPHCCWGNSALYVCLLVHLFGTGSSGCSPWHPVQCKYRLHTEPEMCNIL